MTTQTVFKLPVFGDIYTGEHEYSQAALIARIGYQHQSARNTLSRSPSIEIGSFGSSVLYTAPAANLDWAHTTANNNLVRAEANYRNYRYRQRAFASQDGPLTDLSLTAFFVASPSWTFFGGPDFVAKDTPAAIDAKRQWSGRLGVSKAFGKTASLLLIGSYRHRDNRAYSELLEAKRGDDQHNATAIAPLPALKCAGLTPEIVVQHTRLESKHRLALFLPAHGGEREA